MFKSRRTINLHSAAYLCSRSRVSQLIAIYFPFSNMVVGRQTGVAIRTSSDAKACICGSSQLTKQKLSQVKACDRISVTTIV